MDLAGNLVFLALLFGLMYFMLIRPQKRRAEQHRALIESIGLGDEVATIGGMLGTVSALRDDQIELEVAPGTRVRFYKSAIARKVAAEGATDPAASDETAE